MDSAIEIIVARLDRESEAGALLSAQERERAARFRFDADRRRYIAAHSRLRELLGARCGLPPESLQLLPARQGKPDLGGSGLQFSMSRSGELAAYVFAWDRAVGIDVQEILPLAEVDAIAARTFPAREWRSYAAPPTCDKAQRFFRGWTRTEALAKALGRGLTVPREALDAALEEQWVLCSFTPAPGFAAAVAVRQ